MQLRKNQINALNSFRDACDSSLIKIEDVHQCLCGSHNYKTLSYNDRYGLPFPTAVCVDCGLVFQSRRISNSSQQLFYEEYYWDIVRPKNSKYTPENDLSDYKKISNLLQGRPDITILEVGCGSGSRIITLANHLSDLKLSFKGFATDFIDQPESLVGHPFIQYIKGQTIPLTTSKYDIVILSHLVEHLVDPGEFLKQLFLCVKDDGLVFVEVPGIHDVMNKKQYEYSYEIYTNLAHNFNFSLVTLQQLFSRFGFSLRYGSEEIKALFSKSNFHEKSVPLCSGEYLRVLQSISICGIKSHNLWSSSSYKIKSFIKSIFFSLNLL